MGRSALRLALHFDWNPFSGEPLQALDERAEDLAGGDSHQEAEGDSVVDERIVGKVSTPLALKTHPQEDLPNPLARIDWQ